jgi:GNAT superfamily N-acetyltransferase
MRISEVRTKADIRSFLDLPHAIYAGDPHWVCPLENDIEAVFDPARNNYHTHGQCTRWLLKNDAGKVIGRIAAFVDDRKARLSHPYHGGCGFFECINDQSAANLLFDTARNWLLERGMEAMDGPINFGENDMWWGLLVEGFSRPYYGMNYNPPYYRQLFETYGFQVEYQQISNKIDIRKPFPERFDKIARWVAARPGHSFDHLHVKEFDRYAQEFLDIYNDGWKDFEGFTPMKFETVREAFEKMKPIVDEKLIWYAYVKGDPAAFVMILPDTNELIDGLNGKLNLPGKLKFVWKKMTTKHKRMRAVIMGTKEKYRNLGLESGLFIKLKEYVLPLGHYEELELSWVGDFNTKMMSIHEATGAVFAKKHATYRYLFPGT